jgi:hypothetical protein
VLSRSVPAELLKPIAGRHPQIGEQLGSVEDHQLPEGDPMELRVELPHPLPTPDPFGVFVGERLQHGLSITPDVMNAKRYATLMASLDRKQIVRLRG